MGGNMTTKEFILGVADGELSKKDILDYAKEYYTTCSGLDSLLIKMTAQTMNEPEIVFTGDRDGDGMEEIKDISRVSIVEKKQEDRLFEAMGIIEAYKENLEIPHREQATTDTQSLPPEPQQMELKDLLPEKLKTDEAIKVFQRGIDARLITYSPEGLKWKHTKQLLAYFATKVSEKFVLTNKLDKDGNNTTAWKPFEALFREQDLKGAKQNWMRLNTKFEPTGFEKVDALF